MAFAPGIMSVMGRWPGTSNSQESVAAAEPLWSVAVTWTKEPAVSVSVHGSLTPFLFEMFTSSMIEMFAGPVPLTFTTIP